MNESSRTMRYARALGWATFAAAPILLAALAVIASRPNADAAMITNAAIAAWIAGTLAFGASLMHGAGRTRAARVIGAIAALVVIASCAFLAWSASELRGRGARERERAGLFPRVLDGEPRLVHPRLALSVPRVESRESARGARLRSEHACGGE